MFYPYCNAVAAIVYNGSFNATASGPCSASQMFGTVVKLTESTKIAAELAITASPELFQQVCESGSSSDSAVESFITELCNELGIS